MSRYGLFMRPGDLGSEKEEQCSEWKWEVILQQVERVSITS
jgi:hypothetical protein